jgi:hypothetical protein
MGGEGNSVRKMIAVFEWAIIIVMYVRWKDVLPLFRDNLQMQLTAKANVFRFAPFSIYRFLGRVRRKPGAALNPSEIALPNNQELEHLEYAGVLQTGDQSVSMQAISNDNQARGLLVD